MNHTITIQTKAGYIKRTTQICATKYEGDIPSTLEDLLTLPGTPCVYYSYSSRYNYIN